MDELFKLAYDKYLDDVNQVEKMIDQFQKDEIKRMEPVREYFISQIIHDYSEKIYAAVERHKSQATLYRINLNRNNKANWPQYHYNMGRKSYRILDLLNNPDDQIWVDLNAFFNTVEDGKEGFKLKFLNTSRSVWCIFIYWRDHWDEDIPHFVLSPTNKEDKFLIDDEDSDSDSESDSDLDDFSDEE